MACEAWKERLIAELYGELPTEDERERVRAHRETCPVCRTGFEELSAARSALRATDLPLPASPRIVLFPLARRRAVLPFAAGFAAAALLALGIAGGWVLRGPAEAGTPVAGLSRTDVDALVQSRLAEQRQAFEQSLAARGSGGALTRDELVELLTASERRIDQRRATDMRYLLGEIGAAELRAGASIGETQRALQYVALANNPDASLH
jgi:hypothetical protein